MKRSYWRRDEPQFHRIFDIALETLREPALAHASEGCIVSRDEGTESATYLVRIAPGWRYVELADEATIEGFVLEGSLKVNGQQIGSGSYVFIPQGSDATELASQTGAFLLLFWNPTMPMFPPPYTQVTVTKWSDVPWDETPRRLGIHGGFHKSFRKPDFSGGDFEGGPAGYLRWLLMMPGYSDGRQHVHHQCWEEVFLLRGDLFMPGRGVLGFGGYLANPQELWHAPIASQSSALTIVQTDAPMGVWEYRQYPNGPELVDDYLDTRSWMSVPEHQTWDAMTEYHWHESSPEYQAWRESPEWREWGDAVGAGTASRFRAMYSRKDVVV